VARDMVNVGGLSVYIAQNAGRLACLPIAIVSFWCPGMPSNDVTTRLAALSARSLLLIFACLLSFCSIVCSPNLTLHWSVETMAAMRGL
jgi:hypothetical protein